MNRQAAGLRRFPPAAASQGKSWASSGSEVELGLWLSESCQQEC